MGLFCLMFFARFLDLLWYFLFVFLCFFVRILLCGLSAKIAHICDMQEFFGLAVQVFDEVPPH